MIWETSPMEDDDRVICDTMRCVNTTASSSTSQSGPLVVLVHGACHGAWCWAPLQAELDRRGIPSLAIDLPGHGASTEALQDLHGDADALARLVAHLQRDVVLVGHSYGGAVISQADTEPYARHLVFLSALVPDVGESPSALMAALPRVAGPGVKLFRRRDDGTLDADPALAPATFYNRCTDAEAAAATARLGPQRAATLKQPASRAAWQHIASTYIRCLDDQAVPLAAQDVLSKRCTNVVSLDADHSPFLGQPADLADLIAPMAR